MTIRFLFIGKKISLSERNRLKGFIERMFKEHKQVVSSLTYIFCSDTFLLDINRRFLKHDYLTDIITFNLSEPGMEMEGEIYISTDRVRDNARNFGVSIKEELHRVIFHGALHLCGLNDKTKKDKAEMTREEDYYLEKYFI